MSLEAKIEGLQLVIEKLNVNIERLITAQSAGAAPVAEAAADKKTTRTAKKDAAKEEPAKPTHTLDEVRAKLFEYRDHDGHGSLDVGKGAARKILADVAKAPKVDEIKPEMFAAVIKACEEGIAALEAGGGNGEEDDI